MEKNRQLARIVDRHLDYLATQEGLNPDSVVEGLNSGRMVLLANSMRENIRPVLIGQPASVKVNANIGTSPFINNAQLEMEKGLVALEAGAHTIMDLSIAGDLNLIRKRILEDIDIPLGTVPMYAVAQKYIDAGRSPADMDPEELFAEIEKQGEQGVDFMTVHCGVTRAAARMAREAERITGVVSRGGSLLVRWMEDNERENPLYEQFVRLLQIARRYNITLSLGDGMRPGSGHDAGDRPQWEEVVVLSELAVQAREYGVQVMIEGPGHVPLDQIPAQIRGIKRLCGHAPLYVLGPLTTDIAPGYDHIAGAIGGAVAAANGADFLCYLTPAEHLTLPDKNDVREGVMASLVAAHSGEVALGRGRAVKRNEEMSRARKALNWDKMSELTLDPAKMAQRRKDFNNKEECAMCGEFCAIKLLS